MKIYIIEPIEGTALWHPWIGFVVRAESEHAARILCTSTATGEYGGRTPPWLDSSLSTCVELTADGDAGVILQDLGS
jgi:hypothetical protein